MEKQNQDGTQSIGHQMEVTAKEWILTSTSHGLPNIFRNENKILKILWIVCFALSAGVCVFSLYTNLMAYLDHDVVSKISIVYENPMTFPTVTFCNGNPFVTQEGIDFVKSTMTSMNLSTIDSPLMKLLINYPKAQITANYYYMNFVIKKFAVVQNETTKRSYGRSLSDFMIGCLYANVPCNEADINWYYSADYGNCFQFNSQSLIKNGKPLMQTTYTGAEYGLSLLLFVGVPNDTYTLALSSGAVVIINSQNSSPAPYKSIGAAAGMETRVAISRQITKQLPDPFSDCIENLDSPDDFDSEMYRKTLLMNYTYAQDNCISLAQYNRLNTICNCTVGSLDILGAKPCVSIQEQMCSYQAFSQSTAEINSKIVDQCPLECEREGYSFSTSSMEFITGSYGQWLINDQSIINRLQKIGLSPTLENIKRSVACLTIYFEQTKYTLISESPTQGFFDLLGSMGGTLGLWIGISFLSFIEIFEVIIQIIIIMLKFFSEKKAKIKPGTDLLRPETSNNKKELQNAQSNKHVQIRALF